MHKYFRLFLTGLVTVLLLCSITAQGQELGERLVVPTESPFKLTMSIVGESYVTVPDVIYGEELPHFQLILDLKLRYTNQGKEVVRFDKDCMGLDDIVIYDDPIRGPTIRTIAA